MPDVVVNARKGSGARPLGAGTGCRVFIDFDNTITRGDVLDGIIERFAAGDEWRALEMAWSRGEIGAQQCLDGQMRCLRASRAEFEQHLEGVEFDPGFGALCDLLRRESIELTIVSDNFDEFIDAILRRKGYAHVRRFANHLECRDDRVVPSFPFANPECPACAHCKKTHFLPPRHDARTVVYIGDGRSDLCPARHADLVYAKSTLLHVLRTEGVPCVAFDTLADVAASLSTLPHDAHT